MSARYCGQCGASLQSTAKFCPRCGLGLEDSSPPGAVVDQPGPAPGAPVEPVRITIPSVPAGAAAQWARAALSGGLAAVGAYLLALLVAHQASVPAMRSAMEAGAPGLGTNLQQNLLHSAAGKLAPQFARLNLAGWLMAPIDGIATADGAEPLAQSALRVTFHLVVSLAGGLLLAMLPTVVAAFVIGRKAITGGRHLGWPELLVGAAGYACLVSMIVVSGPIDISQRPLFSDGTSAIRVSVGLFPVLYNAFFVALLGYTLGTLLTTGGPAHVDSPVRTWLGRLPVGVRTGIRALAVNLVLTLVIALIGVGVATAYTDSRSGVDPVLQKTLGAGLISSLLMTLSAAPALLLALSGGVISAQASTTAIDNGSAWGIAWNSVQGLRAEGLFEQSDEMMTTITLCALGLGLLLAIPLVRAGMVIARSDRPSMWRQGLLASATYLSGCLLVAQACRIDASASATISGELATTIGTAHVAQAFVGLDYLGSVGGLWLPAAAWLTIGLLVGGRSVAPEVDAAPPPEPTSVRKREEREDGSAGMHGNVMCVSKTPRSARTS